MTNVKSQNKQEFFELLADPDMSMQLEKLLVNAYNLGQYPLNEEIEIALFSIASISLFFLFITLPKGLCGFIFKNPTTLGT